MVRERCIRLNIIQKTRTYWLPLISLAIPAMIESLLQSIVGFVDSLFISKLGLVEVASVGMANAILQIYFAVFLATGTAATVLVATYTGANDSQKVKKVISHSIILTIVIGIVFGILSFFFAEHMFRLMGANEHVLQTGIVYFQIVATPSIFISMMFTLGAIVRGTGDTKTPMRIGLWMNGIHIILDYIFIFGVCFEGFGIIGAGIATVFARIFGVILLFIHLKKKQLLVFSTDMWTFQKSVMLQFVRLSIPSSMERLFMRFGQIIYFGMIVRMGTEVYAAHTLTGNFTLFSSIVGTSLATATTTLVGKSLGAGQYNEAKAYSFISIVCTSVMMTGVTFLLFLTSPLTARVFTHNETVISLIVAVLGIDTIAQPATAIVTILTSVLQANKDAKFPMYVTAFGIWAIRTVGVYILGIHFELGLIGVWLSIAIDNYVRAALLYWRYRSLTWSRGVN